MGKGRSAIAAGGADPFVGHGPFPLTRGGPALTGPAYNGGACLQRGPAYDGGPALMVDTGLLRLAAGALHSCRSPPLHARPHTCPAPHVHARMCTCSARVRRPHDEPGPADAVGPVVRAPPGESSPGESR